MFIKLHAQVRDNKEPKDGYDETLIDLGLEEYLEKDDNQVDKTYVEIMVNPSEIIMITDRHDHSVVDLKYSEDGFYSICVRETFSDIEEML